MERMEKVMEGVLRYQAQGLTVEALTAMIAGVAVLGLGCIVVSRRKSMRRDGNEFNTLVGGSVSMLSNSDSLLSNSAVKREIDGYEILFEGARKTTGKITSKKSIEKRKKEYQRMVDAFYNLVTDFYTFGWCQSFHFAPRWIDETFVESIKRFEYHLCSLLQMTPGKKALDVGCGVGGPMRNMAVFSGSNIEGITINQYQVNVGNRYNENQGLSKQCHLTQGDFQKMPFGNETFDCAYAIEATCHSPCKVQTFKEVARVLKKGGEFAGAEWCVLDTYDENISRHVELKEGIEVGNGLPTLAKPAEVVKSLEEAGFEVLVHYDANKGSHDVNQIPFYATLKGSWSLTGFRMTRCGRWLTHGIVSVLQFLKIAPNGSTQVSRLLNKTALDLVGAGELEIFTPSYVFHARKK